MDAQNFVVKKDWGNKKIRQGSDSLLFSKVKILGIKGATYPPIRKFVGYVKNVKILGIKGATYPLIRKFVGYVKM